MKQQRIKEKTDDFFTSNKSFYLNGILNYQMFQSFFLNFDQVTYSDFCKKIKTPLNIIHHAIQDKKWLNFLGITLFNLFISEFILLNHKNKYNSNQKIFALNSFSEFLQWTEKTIQNDFVCDQMKTEKILILFQSSNLGYFIYKLLQDTSRDDLLEINETKRFICDFIILRKGLYSKPITKRLKKFMMVSLGSQRKTILQFDEIFNFICNQSD